MAGKLHGVYLNQPQAKCSIYESGQMVFRALQLSDKFDLEYFALEPSTAAHIPPADFYLFNYHHATMAWLDTKSLAALPGKKITVVLEMLPGNPFVYVSPDVFDAYLVLDPTMNIENSKVYGFPRPLEEVNAVSPYLEKAIPWIGTFGFSTPGKGFELVVDAVNREFEEAVVRINIPPGTFADDHAFRMHKRNYADYLTELCSQVAKPGIEVRVSREFMSKEQLIEWCAQNTLNCFLYSRNQPGLSATTDQCITTGRPLAVSANETFRHLHDFIRPYPERSLKEAILASPDEVRRMQQAWTPRNFSLRMERVLGDLGLLEQQSNLQAPFGRLKKPPLWLIVLPTDQSAEEQLHTWQLSQALKRNRAVDVLELKLSNDSNFQQAAKEAKRILLLGQIERYAEFDLSTLTAFQSKTCWLSEYKQDSLGTGAQQLHFQPEGTLSRILPLNCNEQPIPDVITICVPLLNEQAEKYELAIREIEKNFEQANIIFYAPFLAPALQAQLLTYISKPGISCSFVHEPYAPEKLLTLFGYCSLTLFIKPEREERVFIDFALAAQRPIAILPDNTSSAFRRFLAASFLDKKSLSEILASGIAPFVPLYNDWSEVRFRNLLLESLDTIASSGVPIDHQTNGFNRTLSSSDQGSYTAALETLRRLASDIVERTKPEQLIVHAFVLDTIGRYVTPSTHPRILGIETLQDPVVPSLEKLGFEVCEVDSRINFSLDEFYQHPTTAYQSYEIIFATTALDSSQNPELFLAQIGDLLAPGGIAILTCSFENSSSTFQPSEHFRVFQERDFRERFLPALNDCDWVDIPHWQSNSAARPMYATLVIAKSERLQ